MTIGIERANAVLATRALIIQIGRVLIAKRNKTTKNVGIPRELLEALVLRLKHYPTDLDIQMSADGLPKIWGDIQLTETTEIKSDKGA